MQQSICKLYFIKLNNNVFLNVSRLTYPCISANTVAPFLSMMASISSITSKYASLLVYLTPVRLQGILDNCPEGKVPETLY